MSAKTWMGLPASRTRAMAAPSSSICVAPRAGSRRRTTRAPMSSRWTASSKASMRSRSVGGASGPASQAKASGFSRAGPSSSIHPTVVSALAAAQRPAPAMVARAFFIMVRIGRRSFGFGASGGGAAGGCQDRASGVRPDHRRSGAWPSRRVLARSSDSLGGRCVAASPRSGPPGHAQAYPSPSRSSSSRPKRCPTSWRIVIMICS